MSRHHPQHRRYTRASVSWQSPNSRLQRYIVKHLPLLLLLLVTQFLAPTMGHTPMPVSVMAYATVDEKTLYCLGGSTEYNITATTSYVYFIYPTSQFVALDLQQQPWSSSSPPWRTLPNVIVPHFGASMTVSRDKQRLIIWEPSDPKMTISFYSLATGSWLQSQMLPSGTDKLWGSRVALDPRTGLLYAPSASNNGTAMIVYNPDTYTSSFLDMPPESATVNIANLVWYSLVWSTYRNSMLIYGGIQFRGPSLGNPKLIEYTPSSNQWAIVPTTGPNPGNINSHCMVPAYNGTKMVVFGGKDFYTGLELSSIYLLELKTLVWTRGVDANSSQKRRNMACTVTGDNFIAWGGDSYPNIISTLLIYNLKTDEWMTQISMPPPPPPPVNWAAIVGGVAAGVIILVALGFFYQRHKIRHGKEDRQTPPPMQQYPDSAPEANVHNPEDTSSYQTQPIIYIPQPPTYPPQPNPYSPQSPVYSPSHGTYSPPQPMPYSPTHSAMSPKDGITDFVESPVATSLLFPEMVATRSPQVISAYEYADQQNLWQQRHPQDAGAIDVVSQAPQPPYVR